MMDSQINSKIMKCSTTGQKSTQSDSNTQTLNIYICVETPSPCCPKNIWQQWLWKLQKLRTHHGNLTRCLQHQQKCVYVISVSAVVHNVSVCSLNIRPLFLSFNVKNVMHINKIIFSRHHRERKHCKLNGKNKTLHI